MNWKKRKKRTKLFKHCKTYCRNYKDYKQNLILCCQIYRYMNMTQTQFHKWLKNNDLDYVNDMMETNFFPSVIQAELRKIAKRIIGDMSIVDCLFPMKQIGHLEVDKDGHSKIVIDNPYTNNFNIELQGVLL